MLLREPSNRSSFSKQTMPENQIMTVLHHPPSCSPFQQTVLKPEPHKALLPQSLHRSWSLLLSCMLEEHSWDIFVSGFVGCLERCISCAPLGLSWIGTRIISALN